MLKKFLFGTLIIATLLSCSQGPSEPNGDGSFTFLFMTDLHLRPGIAERSFEIVVDTALTMNADFVLTGGDLIFDAMRGNVARTDSLYDLYKRSIARLNMPVYPAIGNHDLFGIYAESDIDSTHADYKFGMFRRQFGDDYYHFRHKGWHFFVLNGFDTEGYRWVSKFGNEQLQWILRTLETIGPDEPLCVVVHVPVATMYDYFNPRRESMPVAEVVYQDHKAFLDLFEGHNLRLVLQGHKHWIEEIQVRNKTRFITGGSVAGRPSWGATPNGEEGFLKFTVDGQHADWEYIYYQRLTE